MKKYNILILLFIAGFFSSCEDVLEPKQTNEWTDQTVWYVPRMAEGVLLQAYQAMSTVPDDFDNNFLDAATDNAVTNNLTSSVYRIAKGGITPQNGLLGNWDLCYKQLQNINLFLEKGLADTIKYDRVSNVTDSLTKRRLAGEAYFLRAWWSFQLLQRYGGRTDDGRVLGYPIVNHFLSEEEVKSTSFVRKTYEECVKQITADLDSASLRLPAKYTGTDAVVGVSKVGRASGTAAQALKVRALLYAASPAYQSSDVVSIQGMGQYSVTDQSAYLSKWVKAAMYADTLIRSTGFGTYYAATATSLADAGNTTPDDFLMRSYNQGNGMESHHFPPFYYGTANTLPSQNLVDAFPALNGYPITDNRSGYNPNRPYINRDKRLDLNVYYQDRTFATSQGTIDVVYGGKDSRSYSNNATRTGYYVAKFLSKKNDMLNPIQKLTTTRYYSFLRKAEVFLNYAEAANEAWGPNAKGPGCKYTAYEVIREIRRLSGGITDLTYLNEMAASKDLFRQLIQNERRIEFAFENQRYYDMRRWLLPLNESVKGVKVQRASDGTLSFNVFEVETRDMNDLRYYYLPIPADEMLKSRDLENNLGWK